MAVWWHGSTRRLLACHHHLLLRRHLLTTTTLRWHRSTRRLLLARHRHLLLLGWEAAALHAAEKEADAKADVSGANMVQPISSPPPTR